VEARRTTAQARGPCTATSTQRRSRSSDASLSSSPRAGGRHEVGTRLLDRVGEDAKTEMAVTSPTCSCRRPSPHGAWLQQQRRAVPLWPVRPSSGTMEGLDLVSPCKRGMREPIARRMRDTNELYYWKAPFFERWSSSLSLPHAGSLSL
jgi:hypothetical protein